MLFFSKKKERYPHGLRSVVTW